MSDPTPPQASPPAPQPRWQALSAVDRRVAGVLVEKAKSTPNAYPMSLNAITTGCNQKSNRDPLMNLDADDVEASLDRLRGMGAVGLIEGHGRVVKYRHYLYDWLGVDKVEIAVMAELLLRGTQTVGGLRGRAARMEPIRDMAQLEPILASLESKGLLIPLTRKGRGQVVTHTIYQAKELDRIKSRYDPAAVGEPSEPAVIPVSTAPVSSAPVSTGPVSDPPAPEPQGNDMQTVETLRRAVEELRLELAQMRSDLDDLSQAYAKTEDEFRRLRDELGA